MKRFLAGWLSVMMLFSVGLCLAEDQDGTDTATIEENMVSVEGEEPGSVSENLRFLQEMMQKEEVQDLLKNDEVKSVTSEIIWRVLVWMVQNRSVTMKILGELGVAEADQRSVEKIWDSAERIARALEKHSESEDGRQLQAELAAVKNDPDILESLLNFHELMTSEDLIALLDALSETAKAQAADTKASDGTLTQEAVERKLDRSTFQGSLMFRILSVMDQSEWARKSLPKLLENENLWALLIHLSRGNRELDQVFRDEVVLLFDDPEINAFLQRTLKEAHALIQTIQSSGPSGAEQEKTDNGDTNGKEIVP